MNKSMTEGSPARLIFLFTIPLLIGNLFQQFYSMADTFIVGRTIGVDALAAVGCTGSIAFLMLGFAQGWTSGLAIIVAQRFGAGDECGVRRSYALGFALSIAAAAVMTIGSVLMARPVLELMQTPSEIIEGAYRYIVVIFGGIGTSMLFNYLSNIARALGDSRTPLIFLVIACLINIILDYAFILYVGMGVEGAAWATVTAQLVSGLLCLWHINRHFHQLHFTREDLSFDGEAVLHAVRIALPMGFQMSIIAIGQIILQFVLNGLGATPVAAFTAANKIDVLAMQPMASFGIAMSTYAAQNYGAGNITRIKQGLRSAMAMSIGYSLCVGALMFFFGSNLVTVFVGPEETEVIRLAQVYLSIGGVCYFILAALFVMRSTLQGLGQSFVTTFAGVMELVMRAFASLLLTIPLGFAGACMANPLAWLGSCVPMFFAYGKLMKRLTAQEMDAAALRAEAV